MASIKPLMLNVYVFTLMMASFAGLARYIVIVNTVYFSGCWPRSGDNSVQLWIPGVGDSSDSSCRDDRVIPAYKEVRSTPSIFYKRKHCITSKDVLL